MRQFPYIRRSANVCLFLSNIAVMRSENWHAMTFDNADQDSGKGLQNVRSIDQKLIELMYCFQLLFMSVSVSAEISSIDVSIWWWSI